MSNALHANSFDKQCQSGGTQIYDVGGRDGLRPSNHIDFNVAPTDQKAGAADVSAMDALKTIAINAAYQYKEEVGRVPSSPESWPTW